MTTDPTAKHMAHARCEAITARTGLQHRCKHRALVTRGARHVCYQHFMAHADPHYIEPTGESFDLSLEQDCGYITPCLIWQGCVTSEGYGSVGVPGMAGKKQVYVHRRAWQREHGDIPEDYVLHHLCEQRRCERVDHLELVPRAEHLLIHEIWRQSPMTVKGRTRV